MSRRPTLIVCMGVSGSGKSTYGQLLADSFDIDFVEADNYHSQANKQRMAAGIPLTDKDREPWMSEVSRVLREKLNDDDSCVLAHSGLRKTHRDRLRQLGFRTIFLHLNGSRGLIARRMRERKDHFMHATMLDSQLDALDVTDDEPDVVKIDIDSDEAQVMDRISRLVDNFMPTRIVR